MDNSVYQPLSHALQQPTPVPQPSYSQNTPASIQKTSDRDARIDTSVRHEEEEEEEDEVEGTVVVSAASVESKQSCVNFNVYKIVYFLNIFSCAFCFLVAQRLASLQSPRQGEDREDQKAQRTKNLGIMVL